jgi:hypothetical protein
MFRPRKLPTIAAIEAGFSVVTNVAVAHEKVPNQYSHQQQDDENDQIAPAPALEDRASRLIAPDKCT